MHDTFVNIVQIVVGAPLVVALGRHKACPYGLFIRCAH